MDICCWYTSSSYVYGIWWFYLSYWLLCICVWHRFVFSFFSFFCSGVPLQENDSVNFETPKCIEWSKNIGWFIINRKRCKWMMKVVKSRTFVIVRVQTAWNMLPHDCTLIDSSRREILWRCLLLWSVLFCFGILSKIKILFISPVRFSVGSVQILSLLLTSSCQFWNYWNKLVHYSTHNSCRLGRRTDGVMSHLHICLIRWQSYEAKQKMIVNINDTCMISRLNSWSPCFSWS